MSYLRYLLITIGLLLSSCQSQDQAVNLEPSLSKLSTLGSGYNKSFALKVIDQRPHPDFIGFQETTPESDYKNLDSKSPKKPKIAIAKITNNQDLVALVKNDFLAILQKKGLRLKRFTTNKIKITIVELSFTHKGLRNTAHSTIKVSLSNRTKDAEKTYQKEITSDQPLLHDLTLGIAFSADKDYYNSIINDCLTQNISDIVTDESLWNFLN